MKRRIGLLFKLYLVLLLIFLLQKVVFMLVNAPYAAGVPFGQCVAVLWHGLRLDSVTASYLLVLPWLVLLISCFVKKMPLRPILAPYYVVVALIISFLFSADVIMYHFWGAKFDANDFIYAANPKDLFASVHWWTIPLGIAAIGLIAWLYAWCLLKITPRTMQRIDNKWLSLLFLLVGGILFLGMRGGVSQSTANPSYAYFSKYAFCNHSALNPTFNIFHSLFKTEDLEHEFNYMSDSEAQAIVAPCFADDGEILDTLLNVSRPDILMIVWEGGGWDMTMNDSVGPNITRYAADGVLFNNCYANNFRTDRGLVSILNGWPGLPTTSLMKMGAICGRLPSLAHTLQDEGYATSFVYGGDIDFTNMCGYLLETGFEKVSGKEVFGKNARLSSWGAPDAYTLLPLVIARNSAKNKPRFDVLLTRARYRVRSKSNIHRRLAFFLLFHAP